MIEKLTEEVEVRTFLVNVNCPNPNCSGKLASDGMMRNKDGQHGGKLEYRHACGTCRAGYWLPEVYPKYRYEPIQRPKAALNHTPGTARLEVKKEE